MARSQLKREQEAQRPIYPSGWEYYTDFCSEQEEEQFFLYKKKWKTIKAYNSTNNLSKTDIELIALIYGLTHSKPLEKAYLTKEILFKELGIDSERQLLRIRKNISHIFSSKWKKRTKTAEGYKSKVYIFEATSQTGFILGISKYYKKVNLGHFCPTSYNKYENNKKNIESNFLQNSQEAISDKNSTIQITTLPKEPVRPVRLKKRLSNERKKPTKAERKARVYHFNQYKESKDLKHHYPLTKEEGSKLQTLSGRDFSLNAMNEILLDMSKRLDNRFCSKAQFMAYFGKCLRFEMRDAVKTGNDNFHIKANVTPARREEIDKEKQVQQYLAEVEQKAISHVCPENQLKARLANTLEPLRSYELLSNIKDFEVFGNTMRIHLRNRIELSSHDKNIILSQIQCIYATVEKKIEIAEYVVENSFQQINGHRGVEIKVTANIPTLQKDAWGEICRKLIETLGIHVYNNWFSRLKPVIDEQNKTIELKAPNLFIGQWVESTYGETIQKIAKNLSVEVRLC